MTELLAPAGDMEALIAAISNGANAIYLGMKSFGARAYASNFDNETLKEAISYAHLRNVKIYVTMNTIVFDSELPAAYKQIDDLYNLGVDGLIIQDLAIFHHVVAHYPKMEAHCSTQMGIDDLEGTLLFKELGSKRVVLSREVPFEKIKEIKANAKIPLEIFCHGALCVSYSGNCLMSGLIGYRSGNRGRCVGSCRKKYQVINTTTGEELTDSYIFSMKDLNTIDNIQALSKYADSVKIEGRMKEPVYVANVISIYRKALDGCATREDKLNLNKTFNRTYTKGYLFGEDKKNITNIKRPNNYGFLIGKITKKTKAGYEITLDIPLFQQDIIRIDHNDTDVNLSATKLYDAEDNFINRSYKKNGKEICYIKVKEELSVGDNVYKTKDQAYMSYLETTYPKEYKRIPVDFYIYGSVGYPVSVTCKMSDTEVSFESDFLLEKAMNKPTDHEVLVKQFERLNDTPYELGELESYMDEAFIPVSKLNELRRKAITLLNEKRLTPRTPLLLKEDTYQKLCFDIQKPELAVYCTTEEQYNAALSCGIKHIYFKNVVRRNENNYPPMDGEILVGGYGGIYKYRNTNPFVTDFSLNAVNSEAVYELFKLGAKRVTLSYEINQNEIKNLMESYQAKTGGYPNLEMIVYGHSHMLFTHYCPLKVLNQCGKCHENKYELKDEYGSFPIINNKDCTTTLINGKILNLIDELEKIENISVYRIQLTIEGEEESKNIIKNFQKKLETNEKTNLFNKETDTRGHFNKEIL